MDAVNTQSLDQDLHSAVTHHQAGRLAEAAEIYRQVLEVDPTNADANHLLGAIAFQEGRFDDAIELIAKATAVKPDEPNFNINLGKALLGAGKATEGAEALWKGGDFATAEAVCRKFIAASPGDPKPYVILARVLADLDRPQEAEDILHKAVACLPHNDARCETGRGGIKDLDPQSLEKLVGNSGKTVFHRLTQAFTYIIDVVGTCNLGCPSCPVGNLTGAGRAKGFMDVDLFTKIVRKIKLESAQETPELWLYNWGEPLLHPELSELIGIARAHDLPVMISTNLNSKLDFKDVIRAAPDTLKISLSGFSQEVYGRTHAKGQIETVKANMRKIRDYMDEFGVDIDVWVGYHIYRHNVTEMKPMHVFTESLGFGFNPVVAFLQPLEKMVEVVEGNFPPDKKDLLDLMIDHPLIKFIKNREYKFPELDCELRTNMMTINHDGTVALCCGVYDPKHMLGVKFTDLPHQELQALKYQHDFCRTCYKYDLQAQYMPDRIVKEDSQVFNAAVGHILRNPRNQT